MRIVMFIISLCLIADASVLIFDPSLYRKSLDFIEETLGPVWTILYGLLFTFCSVFVLVSVFLSRVSFLYVPAAIIMAGIGLFFLLSETRRFGHFADLWASLSDRQYRIAGIIFIILSLLVCYITSTTY
ncbi:MAG: hypothetical protein P8016_01320 [Sedimentisphaerales bacterium]